MRFLQPECVGLKVFEITQAKACGYFIKVESFKMLFEDIVSLDGPHTKSMLKVLFEERGIRIKKQWGQNFLIDQNLLQFIVKTAELSRNDVVLEIGAGTGSLTRLLAQKAGHVFAVEVDRKLFEILEETLKDF